MGSNGREIIAMDVKKRLDNLNYRCDIIYKGFVTKTHAGCNNIAGSIKDATS